MILGYVLKMVKKYLCDKCGKDMEGLIDQMDEFQETWENMGGKELIGEDLVLKPHLCIKCQKGYNKIIRQTNKEIKKYLK